MANINHALEVQGPSGRQLLAEGPLILLTLSFAPFKHSNHETNADDQYLARALQALVVLDYILIIVMRTAAGVLLGRRREALSSTTRNQSSSQLQKGANQNRGPPTLSRDEDPY